MKVISVFAGLGKTTIGNKYSNVCDLQSSPYRYDYSNIEKKDYEKMKSNLSRIVNTEWPKNYLKAIIERINMYDLVLVPSNIDIRQLLIDNHIEFLFVLPGDDNETRQMLLQRYKQRGNNENLIREVMNNFDTWSRNQEDYDYPIVVLDKDKNLEDLLLDLNFLHKL